MVLQRRKVLITGAAGGMGRACARLFGATHDLVLTDVARPTLEGFAVELASEAYTITGLHSGDLGNEELISAIVADTDSAFPLTLIHTAGLSPSQADSRAIMAVNLVATVRLLNAIEPILKPGSCAVLVASLAGHMAPVIPDALSLMADPLGAGFLEAIGTLADTMSDQSRAGASGLGYMLSKQAILALVEQRAVAWGQRGARIVSISPGLILTPMGRKELAETPGTAQVGEMVPAGRVGMAMDIAFAARFLASEEASFITGCDLKIDGGGFALVRQMAAQAGN